MPSTRRRLLAGIATGAGTALAGCAGLPGTGPREVDVVETGDDDELVWQYPATEIDDDSEGIGYLSVEYDGERSHNRTPPALQFQLNTTVGGIAATEEYKDYQADWARFRLGPPGSYTAQHPFEMWVRPPTYPDVRAGYDQRAGRRELVVELPGIDTGGTITLPVVFDPLGDTVPERFHCSVTVQASEPGAFGDSVRASGRGTIDLASAQSP